MTNPTTSLDEIKLTRYLKDEIPGFEGPIEIQQFASGQSNPTYSIKAQSGIYVLRRQPFGPLLKSAHAVDREYRVIEALKATDVPVPRAYHLCSDRDVIGSIFFLMSFEQGHVFHSAALPECDREERNSLYEEMIRVMSNLHNLKPESIGLGDYGKPGNYFERQIGRMSKQYRASETETIGEMEELMEWLPAQIPGDDGQVSLVHGDYHFSNMIFQSNAPRLKAVLDWELSTLGHPFADLAYFCMGLRLPETFPIRGLGGRDRASLGIPNEREIVAQYCRLRGIEKIDNWPFYLAVCLFRFAAIVQGVKKRGLIGNASQGEEALELGNIPAELAKMAVDLIEGRQ